MPFTSTLHADISYELDHDEFAELQEEKLNSISVEGQSEYYVRITESLQLECNGNMLLSLPRKTLPDSLIELDDARTLIERSDIEINEIQEIATVS